MKTKYKYLILGAGPGGLQMGYFMKDRDDYLILEKNDNAGSFFKTQPIHRKLISINKKYNFFTEEEFNWRHDWNSLLSDDPKMRFTEYTEELFPNADVIHGYLNDFAANFNLNIQYGVAANKISKLEDGTFKIETSTGTIYHCETLLSGMGVAGPRIPKDIPGIELTTLYSDQSLDLELYKNKRVGIIGQGNSAFETADALSGVAAFVHVLTRGPIKLAWETHFVGDLRAVNNNLLDMYQLKSLHGVLNPRINKIVKDSSGTLETNHEYDFPNGSPPGSLELTRTYDHIICCTGWNWINSELFEKDIQPATKKDGQYPIISNQWESENIPDLFFIGGAMQSNDRKSASGFIHGFRYNIRTLYNLLMEKNGDAYPTRTFENLDWDSIFDWMYERFSLSAALFQLYGTLCDVLVFSEDMSEAKLQQELPLNYVLDEDPINQHKLIFTLEFGFNHFEESSLSFLGPSDPTDKDCAAFIHPVIRHIYKGEEKVFHFGDSLLGRWDKEHGSGGAIMGYHREFQQWLSKQMNVNFDLSVPVDQNTFRKWSDQEIAMWERNAATPVPKYQCKKG
jgi:thioredoxin reductase